VPQVLIADDNSNIHRSVALALKEAGVEVVAVGNGEAAVRKIAEIKPDLVLADIFMPVRSGYEVCEFVKQDPHFSSIPVVLLIGAFDPFDEREAQRVRADAILKKPFVPPDSLLRTVADLLPQSAARSSPAPAVATGAKPELPSVPAQSSTPAGGAEPAEYMDQAPEEFEPTNARLAWNPSEQPVAFGALLETAGAEAAQADDSVLTSRRDPNLGEPAFWVPKAQQESESGGAETEESPVEFAGLEESPEEEQPISEVARPKPPEHQETTAPELPELELSANPFEETAGQTSQDPALELPEFPSLDLPPAKNLPPLPMPDSSSAPQASEIQRSPAAPETADESLPDLKDFAWAAPSGPGKQILPDPESIEESKSPSDTPGLATLAPFLASLTSAASTREGAEPQKPGDFDSLSEPSDFESEPDELETREPFDGPIAAQLDPAVIEAIAQRVIERMQPKIIELVTRELLRPAVEALVQRELEKK
jgi:CheY-like chemotaxis protein